VEVGVATDRGEMQSLRFNWRAFADVTCPLWAQAVLLDPVEYRRRSGQTMRSARAC
jgi:hypothetical protein